MALLMKTLLREKILEKVAPFVTLQGVGFDISDLTVKCAKLNSSFQFEYFGETAIPEGVIEGGEIKQEDKAIQVFRTWRDKEKKVRSPYAIVSLPEEKSFLRLIQLPKIKLDELGNAIKWEIEANVPLPMEELVYDYEIIPQTSLLQEPGDHLDVMITAFPKVLVESYARVLKQSGFQPVAMELESQAIVRSILPLLEGSGAKIIADIGRNRTSLIVYTGAAIMYTTTIPFGGRYIEEALSKGLGIAAEEAVILKKEIGLDRKAYDGKVFSSLLPPLTALSEELHKTAEYYQGHGGHAHEGTGVIAEIWLIGGDANLFGLTSFLSSSLQTPVRVADPLKVLLARTKDIVSPLARNQSPAFATAIGLALRNFMNS